MKTALVMYFGDGEKIKDVAAYTEVFKIGAISPDVVEILKKGDEIRFKRRLSEFKDSFDLLVFADGSGDATLKEIVAEVTETPLAENENARKFLSAVITETGEKGEEHYALLPVESSVVPNLRGAYQGFILDKEDFVVAGLPEDPREFSAMAENYLFPFLENKFDLKRQRLTLKYFGERGELISALDNAKAKADCDFDFFLYEKHGDFKVDLLFKDKNSSESGAVIRSVVSELKDGIYAEEDKTLSERLFDCLSVKNKKIAVAESFTGGRVVAEIIKNSGVSEYLYEGVVAYSNESKENRLGVKREHINRDGAVSSVVAYEMAVGLLRTKKVDVAVATTGIAGPNSDGSKKPVGLCYIAVGTTAGVHTYRLNLKGTREEITETAKNHALFLAIKNLKRM